MHDAKDTQSLTKIPPDSNTIIVVLRGKILICRKNNVVPFILDNVQRLIAAACALAVKDNHRNEYMLKFSFVVADIE
ncbi:hypothetical protein TNCV_4404671 [Trichonephila clavipes]|uniref:Uncharacterized protein n=1 Tax=Trichonephila clavipes TaxID=2585209 RepID=A0A8X6S6Y0_TRICX|nr:hypothetical protein TNCV_4404671 [Trichonephila clavipes]